VIDLVIRRLRDVWRVLRPKHALAQGGRGNVVVGDIAGNATVVNLTWISVGPDASIPLEIRELIAGASARPDALPTPPERPLLD
jgi:hypothetical protein